MNYGRLVLAAVVATIVDMCFGFAVYGNALTSMFAQYPGVYRAADDMSHMPVLMAGVFVCTLAASFIYAKGYEGGSGVAEGVRFGAAIGVFVGGYAGLVYWAVLRIGRNLAITMGAVGLVEWIILGVIIGLVYKPSLKK